MLSARSQWPDQSFRSFNETKGIVKLQFSDYNGFVAELNAMTYFNVSKPKGETRRTETYSDPEFLRTFLSFWRMEETADRRETASSRRRMTSRVARGTRRRAAELCSSSDAAISSDTICSFISMSTRCLSKESWGCRLWQAELIHFLGSKFSFENGPKSSIMVAATEPGTHHFTQSSSFFLSSDSPNNYVTGSFSSTSLPLTNELGHWLKIKQCQNAPFLIYHQEGRFPTVKTINGKFYMI